MKVSTIIPVYKDTSYLLDAIQSSFAQVPREHEVIIVSDGNEPEVEQKIRLFGKIPGVKLEILTENVGLAAARNAGFAASKGEFIRFLDADDLLLPAASTQLAALEENKQASVVIGQYLFADKNLSVTWKADLPTLQGPINSKDILLGWETSISIPIHSALFRKSELARLGTEGPFRAGMRAKEDFIFWAELLSKTDAIVSGEIVCIYRQHGANMCKDIRGMGESYLRAVNLISSNVIRDPALNLEFIDNRLSHFYQFYFRPQRGFLEEKFARWGRSLEILIRRNRMIFAAARNLRHLLSRQ